MIAGAISNLKNKRLQILISNRQIETVLFYVYPINNYLIWKGVVIHDRNKLDRMFENDFIRLPRPFIRMFNLNTAVMLSEIYSEYTYWKSQNKLEQGGWFFSTVENIYNNTGLSKHQQLSACKELEAYGIIKIKYQGLPKKRYFKFDLTVLKKVHSDFRLHLFRPYGNTGSVVPGEQNNEVYFAASF